MERVYKVQKLSNIIGRHSHPGLLLLLAGLALVIALGGLAALSASLALLISIVVLLLALTRKRPQLIAYTLTLLQPLTGGLARGAVVPLLRVSQALVVLGFILMIASSSNRSKSRLTAVDLAFVLYFLTGSVFPMLAMYYRGDYLNLFLPDPIFGVVPLQTLLGPVQYYLLYRIVVATISSKEQVIVILRLMLIASIIVSVIGILQKLDVGPVRTFLATYYPVPAGAGDVVGVSLRISSTLQFFSAVAAYLTYIIILSLISYIARDKLKIPPGLLIVAVLLDGVTLILTGTLAAWIVLPICIFLAFLLMRRIPKIALFALIGLVLAMIIFQPFFADRLDQQIGPGAATGFLPQSFALRIRIWVEITLPAIAQNFLFGAGPVPFSSAYGPVEDSQYIHLLLEGGIFYLLSYLLLMGVAFSVCWRHIKRQSQDIGRVIAIALLIILIALNIMNVAGIYFTYAGGTELLWTLLATAVASRQFNTPELPPNRKGEVRQQVIGESQRL